MFEKFLYNNNCHWIFTEFLKTQYANCETDQNCDLNVARFQPIKTFKKLLQTFSNLLSVVIGWKAGYIQATGHSLHFGKPS